MMDNHKIHITPVKIYVMIALLLIILTAITVSVSFIDLGAYNVTVALVIASVKALLVAFIFMHLLYDNKIYLVIFSMALIFLTIFITLTMFDTTTRGSIYEEKEGPIKKEAPIYNNQNN
jgi:cytochrome c oxidase subunit 4